MSSEEKKPGTHIETIHLPAPTAWPIVMAFGATLAFAGLVTNPGIGVLGAVLTLAGAVGWFRQVLPHEAHEDIPVVVEDIVIETGRPGVEQVAFKPHHAEAFSAERYPVISGIKGGIAGGIAMVPPALLYGYLSHHSIWWPVNLLGGAGLANWHHPSVADIAHFYWGGLFVACVIQAIVSLLVGLLYGAMLPMLPRHPIILGGIVAPVLWTGVIHAALNTINPVLDSNISWGWFLVSQITFGLVAGWIVSRDVRRAATGEPLPLYMRMGIEATGMPREEEGPGESRDENRQDDKQ